MHFVDQKDSGLIPQILANILDSSVNGITLSDPDLEDAPLVYANKAFEVMTGYTQEEIIGKNCRFLQGTDREQKERFEMKEAIKNLKPIQVVLKNYHKNGKLFHNHLNLTPLFDNKGNILYFLGVQYDITEQVYGEQEIERLKKIIKSLEQRLS
ncbi:MAG: PAS domain-containing protein [Nitrosomonadaceae bacterium]